MVAITFIEHDGREHTVQAREGASVMETAKRNRVPGIAADCGGARACATCRVYVDPAWRAATGEPEEGEREMIEFSEDTTEGVRLSCQMEVTPALEGLILRMPKSQHG